MVSSYLDDDQPDSNATVLVVNASTVADLTQTTSIVPACSGTLIAPSLVMMAAHCHSPLVPGARVFVGPGRDMAPWPPYDPVTGAYNFPFIEDTPIPEGAWPQVLYSYPRPYTEQKLWNDVEIVVLDRPILHEAYAKRLRFERPATVQIVDTVYASEFHAGMAGYGSPFFYEVSNVPTARHSAWWLEQQRGFSLVESPDGEGAVWTTTWDDVSSYQGPSIGDSGGPLFWAQDPSDSLGSASQLGVLSHVGHGWECGPGCVALGLLGHDLTQSQAYAIWADVTHPATRAWIETVVAAEGGWLSGFDYVGPCDWTKDRDCDHVYDARDVCPDDYDPLQSDMDGDGVGDQCDNCWLDRNPSQANTNAEAENLVHPPNVHISHDLRWDYAAMQAIRTANRDQRPGDACDTHPTDETAGVEGPLSLPVASAESWQCHVSGGVATGCEWVVNDTIERNPIRANTHGHQPAVSPGMTKMRYCRCPLNHSTESERYDNAVACGCARDVFSFGSWGTMTLAPGGGPAVPDPALDATFASRPEDRVADSARWEWTSDLQSITGTPPPTITPGTPLTGALRAQLAVEGILWSHVEEMDGTSYSFPFDLLASHFRALDVQIRARATGYKVYRGAINLPWWANLAPDTCPNCAFRKPWLVYVDDPIEDLIGLLPEGPVDIGAKVSPSLVGLVGAVLSNPELELIEASEASHWIDHHGGGLRGVALNRATDQVLGAVYAGEEGALVVGELPVLTEGAGAARHGWHAPPASSLLALSGSRGTLYELAGGTLKRRGVPTGDWEDVPLRGWAKPKAPVAMTYRYEDDSLYVVDRSFFPSFARLIQIRPDGTTALRAFWLAPRPVRSIRISTTPEGTLLLAVSRKNRFRVVEIDSDPAVPRILAIGKGRGGELDGAARRDRAGVTVPVRSQGDLVSIEDVVLRALGWQVNADDDWCFR